MIELWSNDDETEFGIKVAGEQNFRAITCNHTNTMFGRIVDCSALGRGQDWSAILDSWISEGTTTRSILAPQAKSPQGRTQLLLN